MLIAGELEGKRDHVTERWKVRAARYPRAAGRSAGHWRQRGHSAGPGAARMGGGRVGACPRRDCAREPLASKKSVRTNCQTRRPTFPERTDPRPSIDRDPYE